MNKQTDLLEVIGNDAENEPDYCGQYYWLWENHTAAPKLEALGYEVSRWVDGERDSFGPLTRGCIGKKDGEVFRLWYG